MEQITWTDNFSVGVSKIDDQHKELVRMVNKLIQAQDLRVDSELISDTLGIMTKYASGHFQTEEKLMTEYNYPDFAAHKECHTHFRKKTVSFSLDTMAYKEEIPSEIIAFLKNWLVDHILQVDKLYQPFFNEIGIQ